MAITPSTDLMLIKCPLELDNKNQITFSSESDQSQYFANLPHLRVTDFTYQRHDGVIRYNAHIDSLLEYNYVMYRNVNYSNKYFYAFIQRMEYVSDNVTKIYIKGDSYQTWMFDLEYKASFVEREHVSDDGVGKHTVDEGLGTGDYLQVSSPININVFDTSNMAVCVAVSQLPNNYELPDQQKTINGIYSGLTYCVFSHSEGLSKVSEWVTDFINLYDENAKAGAINSVFMVPKSFVIGSRMTVCANYDSSHSDRFFYVPTSLDSYVEIASNVSINLNNTLAESYSPVNNKLKTFPYNYLLVTNNAGIDTIFHYEDFVNNNASFSVIGDITPGCSIKCIPMNYLKQSDNNSFKSFNYGIPGGKLPVCPWVNDTYTNWLVENGLSMGIGGLASVGEIGVGIGLIATGAGATVGAGLIAAGVGGIANSLIENRKASLMPDQANGNPIIGDINYSAGQSGFSAYRLSIRKERAKQLDTFFSMFGYKVNSLKVPNLMVEEIGIILKQLMLILKLLFLKKMLKK